MMGAPATWPPSKRSSRAMDIQLSAGADRDGALEVGLGTRSRRAWTGCACEDAQDDHGDVDGLDGVVHSREVTTTTPCTGAAAAAEPGGEEPFDLGRSGGRRGHLRQSRARNIWRDQGLNLT
jgi:hypothetical protein